MSESAFIDLCDQLAGNTWLQWVLIVVGVCFLEDIARCAIGLLVATSRLNWWVAFSGMMIGSLVGDLALYLIGRYAMAFCVSRGWINIGRIEKTKQYFVRHAVKAIIGARFFPGARTVAYVAAGATHYRIFSFLAVLSVVTVAQNLLYLYGTEIVGESVLRYFEDPWKRWAVALMLLLVIFIGHLIVSKRGGRSVEKEPSPPL